MLTDIRTYSYGSSDSYNEYARLTSSPVVPGISSLLSLIVNVIFLIFEQVQFYELVRVEYPSP